MIKLKSDMILFEYFMQKYLYQTYSYIFHSIISDSEISMNVRGVSAGIKDLVVSGFVFVQFLFTHYLAFWTHFVNYEHKRENNWVKIQKAIT